MKTQSEYEALWQDIKSKLEKLAKLDPPQDKLDIYNYPARNIFGASTHQYKINPLAEKQIVKFEECNNIIFPENFRTYMSIIGIPSVGPDYGIYLRHRQENYYLSDPVKLATPSTLKSRKGIGFAKEDDEDQDAYLSETEYEYEFDFDSVENGWIEIGTSGNPCCYYLIINGECRGHVFWWTLDMLGHEGLFEDWYLKWLNKAYEEAKGHIS